MAWAVQRGRRAGGRALAAGSGGYGWSISRRRLTAAAMAWRSPSSELTTRSWRRRAPSTTQASTMSVVAARAASEPAERACLVVAREHVGVAGRDRGSRGVELGQVDDDCCSALAAAEPVPRRRLFSERGRAAVVSQARIGTGAQGRLVSRFRAARCGRVAPPAVAALGSAHR